MGDLDTRTFMRLLVEHVPKLARRSVPTSVKRYGVVQTDQLSGRSASVLVDGDTAAIDVANGTGFALRAGQRVIVEFYPPHGVIVAHVVDDAELQSASIVQGGSMVLLGANLSIPDSAWTDVVYDTTEADSGGFAEAQPATHFLIPTDGFYLAAFSTNYAKNTTGTRHLRFVKNDDETNGVLATSGDNALTTAAVWWHKTFTMPFSLVAGDTVKVQSYQTSGGPLNMEVALGAGNANQPPRFVILRQT